MSITNPVILLSTSLQSMREPWEPISVGNCELCTFSAFHALFFGLHSSYISFHYKAPKEYYMPFLQNMYPSAHFTNTFCFIYCCVTLFRKCHNPYFHRWMCANVSVCSEKGQSFKNICFISSVWTLPWKTFPDFVRGSGKGSGSVIT